MERQVRRANGELASVGRAVPLQDVVDVENEIGRTIALADLDKLEAVDVNVMPSEQLKVVCPPGAVAIHTRFTAEFGHLRSSVNVNVA